LPLVRFFLEQNCNPNCKDIEENTPLHYASQFGYIEILTFLVNDSKADALVKNKYGYYPSDIALNLEVRDLFMKLLVDKEQVLQDPSQKYGRTAFNGVLRHNDRVNMVQRLMT